MHYHELHCIQANEDRSNNPIPGVYHCICEEPPVIVLVDDE